MLFVCRDALLNVLQKLVGIIQAQQTMPILSFVRLEACSNTLTICGTDLEVELSGQILLDKAVKDSMVLTLHARKLQDICKALPEKSELKIVQKDTKVLVTSGRSRFSLATLPVEDFTRFDGADLQWEVKLSQNNLQLLLKSTSFAMGSQDVRYYLNGLLLELYASSVCAVATDGHRLALNRVAAKVNTEHKTQILVPNKSISELIRLLNNTESEAVLNISSSQLCYTSENFVLKTKLIDARFPNYECALPIGLDKKILLDKEGFRNTLSRVAILSNDKVKGVCLHISAGMMKVSAVNQEQENAAEDIPIEYEGEDLEIGFNVKYLLDAVQNCRSDKIELSFKDTVTSILVKEVGIDSQLILVLMPLCLYQNVAAEY